MNKVIERTKDISQQIQALENQYGRKVFLLAATKGQPVEKIISAYQGGIRLFGENYLQEALDKMQYLKESDEDYSNIEWHFIGTLQSNKTKKVAEHFSWVQTVSSFKIAKRLNDERKSDQPLNICIEVNISEETTKTGVLPNDVFQLAAECVKLPNLKLRGLMAIPAPLSDLNALRAEFTKVRNLYQQLQAMGFDLDTLSMGMSHAYKIAIEEGATMVRIGTALFGPRTKVQRVAGHIT